MQENSVKGHICGFLHLNGDFHSPKRHVFLEFFKENRAIHFSKKGTACGYTDTGVSLWNLRNFWKQLLWRTSAKSNSVKKKWLKTYTDHYIKLRTKGKSKFEQDFYKLMDNIVFGKTIENVRKHCDIKFVVTKTERYYYWTLGFPRYIIF